jgi:hypothetical protein
MLSILLCIAFAATSATACLAAAYFSTQASMAAEQELDRTLPEIPPPRSRYANLGDT